MKTRWTIGTVLLTLLLVGVGCGGSSTTDSTTDDGGAPAAATSATEVVVNIQPKSDSQVSGTATFRGTDGQVSLQIEIHNAAPGEHAFHIHEIGDCSSDDGKSAGGHWNPTAHDHGQWSKDPYHLGDVGNIVVGEDGSGTLHMVSEVWSIGSGEANDILGHAVILHAGVDDFVSQPTGAAGGRIGCGEIR
jgi:Cu-Zn family superoxide dismutase